MNIFPFYPYKYHSSKAKYIPAGLPGILHQSEMEPEKISPYVAKHKRYFGKIEKLAFLFVCLFV